jgi:hypothetical protein
VRPPGALRPCDVPADGAPSRSRGDTAQHDLHGDTVPSAPEQAHGRGYDATLDGVEAVPKQT